MVTAKNIIMKFNLNRGKVRTFKERLLMKIDEVPDDELFVLSMM